MSCVYRQAPERYAGTLARFNLVLSCEHGIVLPRAQVRPGSRQGRVVNVGIVVYDDVAVVVEGLRDRSRAEAFLGHPVDISDRLVQMNAWSPTQAASFRSHYMSSLQLTEPRASTLPLFSLVERTAKTFL